MHTAGVKEIKNNLSRYLARVKSGEEILITERGKPIARIIKENEGAISIRHVLGSLIKKGLVAVPSSGINRDIPPRIKVSGKPASEMAVEDRR